MREILLHKTNLNEINQKVRIEPADDPEEYSKSHNKYDFYFHVLTEWQKGGSISFQKGPVFDDKGVEHGVNGTTMEAVLAVLIDRLQCYQKGKYVCRENACAIQHLEEALMWLQQRTKDRVNRGVEGKNEV